MEMSEAREDAERAAEQSKQGMGEDALDWPDHMIEAGARAAWENWGGHGGAVRMVLEGGGSTWDKLSKIERAELKSDFAAGLNVVAKHIALDDTDEKKEPVMSEPTAAEVEAGKAVLESAGLRAFDGHLPGLAEHLARKVLISARAALEAVAPAIAAKAWEEGYAAYRTRPLIDGYLINRSNPYQTRADAIERGES